MRHFLHQTAGRILAAPVLLAVMLAACGAPGPQPAETPQPTPKPETGLTEKPAALPESLPDAGRLLGLEPRQIQDVLGTPSLVRREDAAQVMQFKNGNCVLDIIFYEETPGGAFLSQHLSSRALDGAPVAPRECLAALLPFGFPPGALPPDALAPDVAMPDPGPDANGPGDLPGGEGEEDNEDAGDEVGDTGSQPGTPTGEEPQAEQ